MEGIVQYFVSKVKQIPPNAYESVYLVVTTDTYSREIFGHHISLLDTDLYICLINNALKK